MRRKILLIIRELFCYCFILQPSGEKPTFICVSSSPNSFLANSASSAVLSAFIRSAIFILKGTVNVILNASLLQFLITAQIHIEHSEGFEDFQKNNYKNWTSMISPHWLDILLFTSDWFKENNCFIVNTHWCFTKTNQGRYISWNKNQRKQHTRQNISTA